MTHVYFLKGYYKKKEHVHKGLALCPGFENYVYTSDVTRAVFYSSDLNEFVKLIFK